MKNDVIKQKHHFGFLVLPGFSLIAYAGAIEFLRLANSLQSNTIYTWRTVTPDDCLVKASNGLEIKPDKKLLDDERYDILFICGGGKISHSWSKTIGDWLKQQDRNGIALGSFCTGTYILAKAGLLDDCRCTIHWEFISSLREEFPHLLLTDRIYEIDRDRYTCAGGTAAIDMMNHIVSIQQGHSLTTSINEELLVDYSRSMNDSQRFPLSKKIGTNNTNLIEVVTLMRENTEDPLTVMELSKLVNIGRRQVERLFRNTLNCTPTQYYLTLRLKKARRLLLQTDNPIIDISIACGFTSASHFTKRYRDMFGVPPRNERRYFLQSTDTHL